MKLFKKLISMTLVIVMLIGMMPTTVSATEQNQPEINTENVGFDGGNGIGSLLASELQNKDKNESNNRYTEGYSVVDVKVEGNAAIVEYVVVEEAVLVVGLFSDDGIKLLNSTKTSVQAGENKVKLEFSGQMPEYFIARAYIVDSYTFEPLCQSFETTMYTQEMQSLLNSTIHDYDPKLVWNMDEDETNNFAVFEEEVIRIGMTPGANHIASIDNENAVYVIENADTSFTSLKEGDIISYEYAPNSMLIAKVGKLEVNGTTVKITGAEVKAEEVFSNLKIDVVGSTKDAIVEDDQTGPVAYYGKVGKAPRSTNAEQGHWEDSKLLKFGINPPTYNEKLDDSVSLSVNITATITLGIDITLQYYISSYHTFFKFVTDTITTIDFKFTGTFKEEIPLVNQKIKVPLAGMVAVTFEPTIFVELSGEINIATETTARIGFCMNDFRVTSMNTPPETRDVGENKVSASISIGFDLKPGVMIGSAPITYTAEDVFILKGDLSLAFILTFKVESYTNVTDPDAEVYHACKACTAITVFGSIKLGAEIGVISESFSYPIDLSEYGPWELVRFYLSEDLGKFGVGTCPNMAYRQTLKVVDAERKALANVTISGVSGEVWGVTNADGIVIKYMDGVSAHEVILTHGDETIMKLINPSAEPGVYFFEFNPNAQTGSNVVNINDDPAIYEDLGLIAEGTDKNNKWMLYSNGLLRITGNGKMGDYGPIVARAPWDDYREKITEVVIENGITTVGDCTFYECFNLKRISIPESVTYIGHLAFKLCSSLEEVKIPAAVKEIGEEAFMDCMSLKSVNIPDGVEVIKEYAFKDASSIVTITIPDSVKEIEQCAFMGCKRLMSVKFGTGLEEIGTLAFSGCSALLSADLPDGVKEIRQQGFYECDSLAFVDLGKSLEKIGGSCFSGCQSLTEITIPAPVKEIGGDAFHECDMLGIITFLGDCPEIGHFALTWLNAVAYYPAGNATWINMVNNDHWDFHNVKWVPMSLGEENSSNGLSAPLADIEIEFNENYALRNATFSSLVPNQEYILLVLADTKVTDTLQNDNLLYIAQVTADETGALTHQYAQSQEVGKAYVVLCGTTGKNIKDANVTFPEMNASKEPIAVKPSVVWNGETLVEGVDYLISGKGSYTSGGTFICTLKGINDFSGEVDVEFTVAGSVEEDSSIDGVDVFAVVVVIVVIVVMIAVAAVGIVIYLQKRKRGNENETHE